MPVLKPLKPLRSAPPVGVERDYAVRLRKIVNKTAEIIKREAIQPLPGIITSYKLETGQRADDLGTDLVDLFRNIWDLTLGNLRLSADQEAQLAATKVNKWNRAETTRMLKDKYGVGFYDNDEWLKAKLNMFVTENTELIQSANREFVDQSKEVVISGVQAGMRHEAIAKKILSPVDDSLGRKSALRKAQLRSSVIARDQINKVNGDLTRLRQTRAGVKGYIWRTAGDIRARPLHQGYNGKTYTWEKGTPEGLHPGMDIMCRCYAEPVFLD